MAPPSIIHPSRRANLPHSASKPPISKSSKRRKEAYNADLTSKPSSTSLLKTKIRDLTRHLEHARNMPAGLRVEKERALAGYRGDLRKLEEENHRKKMIGKYHMVRFFERQKATRNLKKLKRKAEQLLPSDTASRKTLKAAIHDAEVDLNYTMYCPLAEKYLSLYAQALKKEEGTEKDDETQESEIQHLISDEATRPPMWSIVETAMADGTLPALRERRPKLDQISRSTKPPKPKREAKRDKAEQDTSMLPRRERRALAAKERSKDPDEDLSDGGFFDR
ncbi:18S rRNA maturation protein [Agyrium rufum]|nr:18S rRNA maturation protein [Agyrium rufum]